MNGKMYCRLLAKLEDVVEQYNKCAYAANQGEHIENVFRAEDVLNEVYETILIIMPETVLIFDEIGGFHPVKQIVINRQVINV